MGSFDTRAKGRNKKGIKMKYTKQQEAFIKAGATLCIECKKGYNGDKSCGLHRGKTCDNYPNCHYKNWKRKEQELKLAENHIKDLNLMVHNGLERENELELKLKRKEQECEELKRKLNPKLKNAHCTYFEGQTGLCKAKEFSRCNPVGCKLYTIDELSTIVDLQHQLDQLKAENEHLAEKEEEARHYHLGCNKQF